MPKQFKAPTVPRKKILFMSTNAAAIAEPTTGPNPRNTASEAPKAPSTPLLHSSRIYDLSSDPSSPALVAGDETTDYLFPLPLATMGTRPRQANVPDLFTQAAPVRDRLRTETSLLQDHTVRECLPLLAGTHASNPSPDGGNACGVPRLERRRHVEFLEEGLEEMPGGFVGYDASRPWIVYWAMAGLSLLGEDAAEYRERVVRTFDAAQNVDGGYGGGHGQLSHCAPSYAAVLSLAMVGGEEALDSMDRRSLWKWLGKLKQSDGGFSVSQGGEIDVRGAYCSMVMISLLNLPLELPQDAPARQYGLESFLDGLPEWLSKCQTYEGGIAGSPGTEAHGAYAFCALGCLCILGDPRDMLSKYLDLPLLISWISARQYAPEGGFAGRTNKLVDACYSHWVGGCWPFIEAALGYSGPRGSREASTAEGLYSREGLIRYILCCSQAEDGGFRDKPSKRADGYHTCYALVGLSSAQHSSCIGLRPIENSGPLDSAFQWTHIDHPSDNEEPRAEQIYDQEDLIGASHPIFVIPFAAVERTQAWFSSKKGF